jgi:hypothetical protein
VARVTVRRAAAAAALTPTASNVQLHGGQHVHASALDDGVFIRALPLKKQMKCQIYINLFLIFHLEYQFV